MVSLTEEIRPDIGKVTLYQNQGCYLDELANIGDHSMNDCKETDRQIEVPPIACSAI